jgi:hypothetical protein
MKTIDCSAYVMPASIRTAHVQRRRPMIFRSRSRPSPRS